MTIRIAGAMATVLIAVAVVAAVAFAVDILDLEHEPAGLALVALTALGAVAFVIARLRSSRRARGQAQHRAPRPGAGRRS